MKYHQHKLYLYLSARDNTGAVRILEVGNLPFTDDLKKFHKEKLAERGKGQSGFSMGHCACRVDTESTVSGKHVFFSTGLWKKQMGDREFDYETRIGASGSYMDDSRKR